MFIFQSYLLLLSTEKKKQKIREQMNSLTFLYVHCTKFRKQQIVTNPTEKLKTKWGLCTQSLLYPQAYDMHHSRLAPTNHLIIIKHLAIVKGANLCPNSLRSDFQIRILLFMRLAPILLKWGRLVTRTKSRPRGG
jgi:ribosomal protein S27E